MTFQNVFITGASSGLGRGLALHYANAGSTVFAAARRREQLETLVSEVKGAGKVVPVVLDVVDLEALEAAIKAAEAQSGGHLDLVIANAGTNAPTHGLSMDWRRVKSILDLNVTAAITTIAAALPAMVARGSGTVVGVSSLAAYRGLPGNGAYSASKAALATFLESLRVDLRGSGVRALCIYPGFVKTELTARHEGKTPMPFLMELEDAVEVMSRGIGRGEARIVFPLAMAATVKLAAALPNGVYAALAGMSPKPKKRAAKE